ncbi:MAG: reverse transcriptase family protein, partial [Sedimenticola sp.]
MKLKLASECISEKDLVIGAIYIPPLQSRFYQEDEFYSLENDIQAKCNQFKYVMILGDVNGHTATSPDYIDFDDFQARLFDLDGSFTDDFNSSSNLLNENIPLTRASKDCTINSIGVKFLDICKSNNIYIVNGRVGKDRNVGEFTFRNISVIDYAIATSNCFKFITDFEITDLDPLFSDGHSLLSVDVRWLTTNTFTKPVEHIQNTESLKRPPKWRNDLKEQYIHNLDTCKVHNIKQLIDELPVNISKHEINSIAYSISEMFNEAAHKTFPNTTFNRSNKNNDKNWFGHQTNKARRKYHAARKLYTKHKNNQYKLELNRASKHYKQTMNTFIMKHKTINEQKLRDMHSNKPKDFWKIIKNLHNNGQQKCGENMPDILDFYTHFKNINADSAPDNSFDSHNINLDNSENDILNNKITTQEISKMIDKCSNSKAASPQDYICYEYIKSTKRQMLPIYCEYFNKIFDYGILPDNWMIGTIKPIYKKKGSARDPKNYRPITILSCLGKLFTAVLNQRINTFLNNNNILNENQAGFRSGYSTTDHILTLKFLLDKLRTNKKKMYCAFIDFSTAFDKIWRNGLWNKLITTGINGKLFRIIFNMYQDIKSCVSANNTISPFFKSYCGVRQGENLSPILFAIYLNDLQSHLMLNNDGIAIEKPNTNIDVYLKLLILLYADDTVIVSDDPHSFQNLLNDFDTYCKTWKLNINMSKTKVIVFGTTKIANFNFTLNGVHVETVKEYKYLGILFSASGSFLNARKQIASQAKKAMYLLYTRIFNLDLPVDIQLKLFDQTILPILTYNCEVWGFENLELIERVHTDYLRKITKSKRSTPLYMLYGELGRYPLEITIKCRMVKYWGKLLHGKPDKISKIFYDNILNSNLNNKWLMHIKRILDD